mmetsp:Transcript_19538/g.28666  ORF Transcript_19538/g.28666 Transcript_19538/m.28666 type:complete len:281 (-) Transcript_19538:245-1087(-)
MSGQDEQLELPPGRRQAAHRNAVWPAGERNSANATAASTGWANAGGSAFMGGLSASAFQGENSPAIGHAMTGASKFEATSQGANVSSNEWHQRYNSGDSSYSESSTAASLRSDSTVSMPSASGLVYRGSRHVIAPLSSSDETRGAGRPKHSGEDYPFTSVRGGGGYADNQHNSSKRSRDQLDLNNRLVRPKTHGIAVAAVGAIEQTAVRTANLSGRSAETTTAPCARATAVALHQPPGFQTFKIVDADTEDPVLNPRQPDEAGKVTDDSEWTVGPGHGGW